MASTAAAIFELVLLVAWTCLSGTPNVLKNPVFAMVLPTQAVLEEIMSTCAIAFAPGLLDAVLTATPPTVAFFKSLPTTVTNRWAVYCLVLEKPKSRPMIYVGSGTDKDLGVSKRLAQYNNKDRSTIPRFVKRAMDDGYVIAHKGLLCWSPIPTASKRYALRAVFLVLETTFAIVFWAMVSRDKDYGMPHLCPWQIEGLDYTGLCSHTAVAEAVPGEENGLTAEQIEAKDAERLRRLQAQRAARHKAKRADEAVWSGVLKRMRPTQRKSKKKAVDTRRFACDICNTVCADQKGLNEHFDTDKHKYAVKGSSKPVKEPLLQARRLQNKAAKRFYCRICQKPYSCNRELNRHNNSKTHKVDAAAKAKAAAAAKSSKKLDIIHYDEFDNAALAMMERAADAWEHHSFTEIIIKVANAECYYRALNFYLQEQPSLITDLLQALTPRIDVNRVVRMFQKSDNIPLIKPFLLNVQSQNKRAVNDAINDLLIEEDDYKQLRDSVEHFDNYEAVALAQRLEKHELVFFRQIASNIYRKNKRWDKSIQLSKQDKLYKDAIETAAMSGKSDVVEELLRYFVDIGSKECYVGMLYACYDLIPLHTVMEISWRHGLNDFTMPFMINYMAQQASAIDQLKRDNEERKAREAENKKEEDTGPILGQSRLMLTQGPMQTGSPAPYANGIVPQPTGYRGF
ncbi:hypothetical protein LTR85_002205 [Meristemomyces frigidus]|nr:hypothetical protein LTR85_002205 [Meristemomyces frigidus]